MMKIMMLKVMSNNNVRKNTNQTKFSNFKMDQIQKMKSPTLMNVKHH